MMCAHRPGITATIGILQRGGIIQTGRGHINILGRHALSATSCNCYRNVKRRFDQLLGP